MSALSSARALLNSRPIVWFDAARTVAVATTIEIALRTVPVTRVARLLGVRVVLDGRPAATGHMSDVRFSQREAERLDTSWRVLRAGPFNASCLRRALVAAWVLRRRDHAVRIGVRKSDGRVRAHAWLELDGVSLDPDAVDHFAILVPVGTAS